MALIVRTAVIACLLVATPAMAHAPVMGIGGVFGGVLHALFIPEHGLSLVALGLVAGRQEHAARRWALLIFTAALTAGLIATALKIETTLAIDVLLLATGILGLLMAAAWAPPMLAAVLSVFVGLAFALDSAPDATSPEDLNRMLIGSGLGAAAVLVIVAESSAFLQGSAPSIAMRVLGSWTAAIAILVLSLRVVTRFTVG
jgi:HupE / UreJ protein